MYVSIFARGSASADSESSGNSSFSASGSTSKSSSNSISFSISAISSSLIEDPIVTPSVLTTSVPISPTPKTLIFASAMRLAIFAFLSVVIVVPSPDCLTWSVSTHCAIKTSTAAPTSTFSASRASVVCDATSCV